MKPRLSKASNNNPERKYRFYLRVISVVLLLCCSGIVSATYKDDVDYTALQSVLGANIPDGSGVNVSHVEDTIEIGDNSAWLPDPNITAFSGKTLTDKTTGAPPGIYSGHATSVGRDFYGNATSTTPGIKAIDAYLADDWLNSGFLLVDPGASGPQPKISTSRIANHSWIGNFTDSDDNPFPAADADAVRRLDWIVARDEFVQLVGVANRGANSPLLSSAYNAIAIGRSDGGHATGSAGIDTSYTAGRARPEIVAPVSSTSSATAKLSSAAALLIETGHADPGLSTDPDITTTNNRNGDVIYNAERSEVIKAALMAGADRSTNNSNGDDITDYRVIPSHQTTNGLDSRFGAGQVNILNSYHIIAAGEQNSVEDQVRGGGVITNTGYDYDPSFGLNGSNEEASYFFSTEAAPARLIASLVWNIDIAGGTTNNFDGSALLYDLNLLLFDITDEPNPLLLGGSKSTQENTENLWLSLDGDRDYELQVVLGENQNSFDWDYALAWQIKAVPLPPALILFGSAIAAFGAFGRVTAARTRGRRDRPQPGPDFKAIAGKESTSSRRIFVRLQGAATGA